MKNDFYAVIDASRLFEHKGVEGYRVIDILDSEKESLKLMGDMMNHKNRHMFSVKPKIHRSVVDRKVKEAHMMLNEVIAVPMSSNPDNPKYKMEIV